MATSEASLNMATDDTLKLRYIPCHLAVLCRCIHSGGCPNTGVQLPVVTENEYNAHRSPKWGLEGGAGKDAHFEKNTAVGFLDPVRAHLPRAFSNFIPNRLAILLSDFENEWCFGGGLYGVLLGVDKEVLSSPNRAKKRCEEAADTPPPQGKDA